MFELIRKTSVMRDESCGYHVDFSGSYTVQEFINELLETNKDGWGNIRLFKDDHLLYDPCCEYKGGKLVSDPFPDNYLCQRITDATACGGWSNMDYILFI